MTALDWPVPVPLTVAAKSCAPPVVRATVAGVTTTWMFGVTVTVAVSNLVGSAALLATTWKVPGTAGAV